MSSNRHCVKRMSLKTLMKIVSLTVALFLSNVSSSPSGPSLKDLQSKKCPELRPTLCIPYGACCNHSEFCYAGICESCFPEEAVKSDLLKWCREQGQHSVAFMRDNSCRFACQNKFTPHELSVLNNTIVYEERYEKAKELQIEHKSYTPDAFGLTAFILVIVLILIKGKPLIQKLTTKTMPQQKCKATTTVETDLECPSSQGIDCNDNKTMPHLNDSKPADSTDDLKHSLHGQKEKPLIETENVNKIQPTNVIQPKGNARPDVDLHRPIYINFCKNCLNSNSIDMDNHEDCEELMDTECGLIKKRHKGTLKRNDQEGDFVKYCLYNEQTTKSAESFPTKTKKKRACGGLGSDDEIKLLMHRSQKDDVSHLQSPSMSSLNAVSSTEEKLFVASLDDSSKDIYRDIDVHLEDKSSAKEKFPVLQRNESKPLAIGIETMPEGPDNKLDGESNLSKV